MAPVFPRFSLFWTVNHHEFRLAAHLEAGDTFLGPDGQLQTLVTSQSESHPDGVFVYNFTVAIAHTYFVSATKHDLPVLVHNSDCVPADGGNASKRITGPALKKARQEFNATKSNAWMNEAAAHPHMYTPDQLLRMKAGEAPIGADGFPMEIHHKTPLAEGGTNLFDNFQFLTRSEHRLGDNYKRNHPRLP